jgi:crotonobetainyl-CoA:carnitine CoA-transferase CaiB-like acyl-CoA transferase
MFKDPQYKARENIAYFKDPRIGEIAMPNVCPRLSDTPGSIEWLGPELGQHNEEVYRGLIAMSDAELRRFMERGVI